MGLRDADAIDSEQLLFPVGVLGTDELLKPLVLLLLIIGRVPDLNDVERVNIRLVPLPLIEVLVVNGTRRFGGGEGGGNGMPG